MKKNKVTTEQLLKAVKQGFTETREYTDKKIEDLAVMVQRGFDGVDKRFDKVESRLDSIEVGLDNIEGEVRQMRIEIKQIWNKLEEIEQKLKEISKTTKEDADAIASDVIDLRRRVEFLENQIKKIQTTQGTQSRHVFSIKRK